MRARCLFACMILPLLAAAQSSSTQQQQQQSSQQQQSGSQQQSSSQQPSSSLPLQVTTVTTVALSTIYVTGIVGESQTTSFGHLTSYSTTEVLTITPTPTNKASAKPSTSTTLPPASTAPTSINGGGTGAPNGAPSPGETGSHGIYGPSETYVAAAVTPRANVVLTIAAGLVVWGVMVLA